MPHFTMMVHAKIHCVCEKSCGLCLATFTAGFVYFEYIACARHCRHYGSMYVTSNRLLVPVELLNPLKMKLNNSPNSFVSKCVCNCRSQRLISRTTYTIRILDLGSFLICWLVLNWALVIIRLPNDERRLVCSAKSRFICSLIAVIRR